VRTGADEFIGYRQSISEAAADGLHIESRGTIPDPEFTLQQGSAAGKNEIGGGGGEDDQVDVVGNPAGGLNRPQAGFQRQIAGGDMLRGEMTKANAGTFDDPAIGGIDPARHQVVVAHRLAWKIAAGAGNT